MPQENASVDQHGHDHDHDHDHGHHNGHAHGPASFDRAFAIGIGLNLAFVVLEAGAGVASNSLALIADAGHNASDVIALLLAWGADWLSRRRPTARRTYGYRRASILAALANAALLLVAVGAIAWEAVQRLLAPEPVLSMTVIVVAALGILVNGATAMLFMRGRHDDLNVRGAYLHMAADAGVSFGVVIAGLLVLATGWLWLDPLVGLIIAGVILWSTWGLAGASIDLAMDAVPSGIDANAVQVYLSSLPGVVEVHDLHIWAMGTKHNALTVHLVRPTAALDDGLLAEVNEHLARRFKISHATLQIERGDRPCALAPMDVV